MKSVTMTYTIKNDFTWRSITSRAIDLACAIITGNNGFAGFMAATASFSYFIDRWIPNPRMKDRHRHAVSYG